MANRKKDLHQRMRPIGEVPSVSEVLNRFIGSQRKLLRGMHLRFATVKRVDEHAFCCDLRFLDEDTIATAVPITTPSWNPRGGAFTYPAINSIAIVGFTRFGADFTKPVILGFIPTGAKTAMRYDKNQTHIHAQPERARAFKAYAGEMGLQSAAGAALHLDRNVHLENYRQNSVGLRDDDQAFLLNSVQRYLQTDAGKLLEGMVYRQDSIKTPDPIKPYLVDKHKEFFIVTVDDQKWDITPPNLAVPWTESRRIIEEFGDGLIAVTEEHDGDARDLKNPYWRHNMHESSPYELLEVIYGTNVGNDPRAEAERYAYVLVPQIWCNREAVGDAANGLMPDLHDLSYKEVNDGKANINGSFWVNEIPIDKDRDEKLQLASAYRMRMRKAKSHLYYESIDKSGKKFVHIGMSGKLDPLGAGRSLEWCSEGSAKIVMGRNVDQGKSIQFDCRGGTKMHMGFDSKLNKRIYARSLDGAAYGGEIVQPNKPKSCIADCELPPPIQKDGHGYHSDIRETAAGAPHAGKLPTDPENDALSWDLNTDQNLHWILGDDSLGAADGKSWVVDSKGCFVWRLGKDSGINDMSFVVQTDGSLEWDTGYDKDNSRSLDWKARGAVQIHIERGDNQHDRALEVQMAKGAYVEIKAPDGTGHALTGILNGPVTISVLKGDVNLTVLDGDVTQYVNGNVTTFATGSIILHSERDIALNAKGKILFNSKDVTTGLSS